MNAEGGYGLSTTPAFVVVKKSIHGFNFLQTRKRYYRNSISLLNSATEKWNAEPVQPSFIIWQLTIFPMFIETTGMKQRFVEFNGGFSRVQLDWLNNVLTFADNNQDRLLRGLQLGVALQNDKATSDIIPSFIDVYFVSSALKMIEKYRFQLNGHLLSFIICNLTQVTFPYTQPLQTPSVLHSHQCVVCFMAGHDHDDGYCVDECGIHHLTLEGAIETPPDSKNISNLSVYYLLCTCIFFLSVDMEITIL
ncbi:uncharacterized protein LOC121295923 [Polyodon spathula]|uniref:uncharacterized protein LOC121295923 n=1 Tax=Polyodon spathula TaxID=7913 RepID=UPI001B7EF450|nr:uncharacterized protein LOC121295923 [Polyodon spathula]